MTGRSRYVILGPTVAVLIVLLAAHSHFTGGHAKAAETKTDAAALAQSAAEFERISSDLKTQISQVESNGASLSSVWQGQQATAVQAALIRFHNAANKQVQQLDALSNQLSSAGVQYDSPRPLQRAMQLGVTSSGQQWNFAGIEGAASVVQGNIAIIQSLLNQGTQSLAKLANVWGGTSSSAYVAMRRTWNDNVNELNASLTDLSTRISQASAAMREVERTVPDLFR